MTRRMLMTAGLAGAVIVSGWAPSAAASPAPTPGADPSAASIVFASTVYPYTMTLPSGWRSTSVSPQDTGDLFEGLSGSARVGSRSPVAGQTVADRVAANRAEVSGSGCTSDPDADKPKNTESLIDKLAFWRTNDKDKPEQYQIVVAETQQTSVVSVQDPGGIPDRTSASEKILSLLRDQLK